MPEISAQEYEAWMAERRRLRKDRQRMQRQRNVAIGAGVIATVGAALGGYAAGGGFSAAVKEGSKGLSDAMKTYSAGPSESPEDASNLATQAPGREAGAAMREEEAAAEAARERRKEKAGETPWLMILVALAAVLYFK